MMLKNKVWVVMICALLVQIIFSGCGTKVLDYSAQIAEAQKDVPFKIIAPTYLPSNIRSNSISISPPDKGYFAGATLIGIAFTGKEPQKPYINILIYEQNISVTNHPGYPEYAFLEIDGITVLEEKTSDESYIVDKYHYAWNQNDINISLDISGNDKPECRKTIESMIQQK
jgi:hypothetical protein